MVERLEDVHRNWLRDLTAGLVGDDLSEARAFRQVAQTIVALARHGRAVIVGRGGVFLTRHLAGGVHIYLVAPFERRVRRMAQQWAVDDETAATRVRQMEAARSSFYQRFFPARTLTPDVFHLTINTAKVSEPLLVDLVSDVVAQAV
jgi:cytidylate kinase